MNEKQKLQILYNHFKHLTTSDVIVTDGFINRVRNNIKDVIGIDHNIKIPDRTMLETLKRKINSPELDIPDDRIEKQDYQDMKDILGVDFEELFKI